MLSLAFPSNDWSHVANEEAVNPEKLSRTQQMSREEPAPFQQLHGGHTLIHKGVII